MYILGLIIQRGLTLIKNCTINPTCLLEGPIQRFINTLIDELIRVFYSIKQKTYHNDENTFYFRAR